MSSQPKNRLSYRHLVKIFRRLGSGERLRGFTAAYLCKVLEIADRHGADRTLDRAGATQE